MAAFPSAYLAYGCRSFGLRSGAAELRLRARAAVAACSRALFTVICNDLQRFCRLLRPFMFWELTESPRDYII